MTEVEERKSWSDWILWVLDLKARLILLVFLGIAIWGPLASREAKAARVYADFESLVIAARITEIGEKLRLQPVPPASPRAKLLLEHLGASRGLQASTIEGHQYEVGESIDTRLGLSGATLKIRPIGREVSTGTIVGVTGFGLLLLLLFRRRGESLMSALIRHLKLATWGLGLFGMLALFSGLDDPRDLRSALYADFLKSVARVADVYQDETTGLDIAVLDVPEGLDSRANRVWLDAATAWDRRGRTTRGTMSQMRVTCPPDLEVVSGEMVAIEFNQYGCRFDDVDYSKWTPRSRWRLALVCGALSLMLTVILVNMEKWRVGVPINASDANPQPDSEAM